MLASGEEAKPEIEKVAEAHATAEDGFDVEGEAAVRWLEERFARMRAGTMPANNYLIVYSQKSELKPQNSSTAFKGLSDDNIDNDDSWLSEDDQIDSFPQTTSFNEKGQDLQCDDEFEEGTTDFAGYEPLPDSDGDDDEGDEGEQPDTSLPPTGPPKIALPKDMDISIKEAWAKIVPEADWLPQLVQDEEANEARLVIE
ncbi:hypothetical protein HK102_003206 [Quaeritorhiza haematococci]|nr:hypothetical protein HK102_003206 [Quaeritorhiza haematococci]